MSDIHVELSLKISDDFGTFLSVCVLFIYRLLLTSAKKEQCITDCTVSNTMEA